MRKKSIFLLKCVRVPHIENTHMDWMISFILTLTILKKKKREIEMRP